MKRRGLEKKSMPRWTLRVSPDIFNWGEWVKEGCGCLLSFLQKKIVKYGADDSVSNVDFGLL